MEISLSQLIKQKKDLIAGISEKFHISLRGAEEFVKLAITDWVKTNYNIQIFEDRLEGTLENLQEAAAGENHEHTEMYPSFAKVAREEGFDHIADIFMAIAVAEKQHEKRYLDLAANITNNRVFKRDKSQTWRCRNCGYLHEGTAAPEECPACAHKQAHFELLGENW